MASDKPAFLQPVEITTLNNTVSVDTTTYNIPVGIYPSVLAVMYELDVQLGGTYTWTMQYDSTSDSLRGVIANTSTMTVSWTDSDLAELLGFATGVLSGSSSYTAPTAPQKCWIPTYVTGKRDGWMIDQRKAVKGTNTVGGNYVGVNATDDKYIRDFDFVHELSTNVLRTHSKTAVEGSKTFENFGLGARSTVSSLSTGISLKGFYYVNNIGDADSTDTTFNQANADSGGVNFEYTSGADKYVFAATLGDRIRPGNYSLPATFTRMNLKFSCITANAPVWA